MTYSVSCTTRPLRGEENNHEHYHFLSKKEFRERADRGDFLEYADVHGNFYGTLKSTVREELRKGNDLIMDIDVQGAAQIRAAAAALPEDDSIRRGFVDIFIAPPSMDELRRRLCGRATDVEEVIEKRLYNAEEEMAHSGSYRYVVVNDNLEDALEKLVHIVEREHERRK